MDPNLCESLSRPRSNQAPSEEELPRIRSLRQACIAGIDEINRQIEELVAQRKCLEYDLEQYDSLLSPIKRVPVEILSKIFHHATVFPGERVIQPTVVTSTVCKAWRQLAVDTPTLWTNIVIQVPKHPRLGYSPIQSRAPGLVEEEERMWDRRVEWLLANTQLWLDRSKECPIFLLLRFNAIDQSRRSTGWDGQDAGLYRALVDLACAVAHRWREIDLDVLTRDKTHHIPQLESISFQTKALRSEGDPPFYPSGLLGAPSLRSAFFLHIDQHWYRLPVNWRGLKKLQLGVQQQEFGGSMSVVGRMISPLGALSLFQACPNLEQFELAVHSVGGDDHHIQHLGNAIESTGVLRMAHMRSLKFYKSEAVEGLLTMLELPLLQQLQFLGSRVGELNEVKRSPRVLSFLYAVDRFGAQLTDIRFNLLLLEDTASVASCFSNLPNILSLQLDSAVPDAQVFGQPAEDSVERSAKLLLSLLTPVIDQGGVSATPTCPKVKRFVCTLRIKGFTESQLLEFIISRSVHSDTNLAKIEEVDVAFAIAQGMDIRGTLKEEGVDLGGMSLRIWYPKPYLYLGMH